MTFAGCILLAVIELTGVAGGDLRARAFFDANNVKVGDPLVLTVDFIGDADFRSLHPPALAKSVSTRDWKVDDASAKTDTYRDARRLTYRVRPMREGVLWFPGLEFSYLGTDGSERMVRSNEIPVHAKRGAEVVVEGMGEDLNEMPRPAELVTELGSKPWGTDASAVGEDALFAWRKACTKPTADAFREFDFPEARLNEARCAILAGEWSRALSVLRALEWRIGQTPEVERDIVAALAVRYENPAVELPVWRQVLRPLLRYAWAGRLAVVAGVLAALAFAFWLFGRIVRALACLTLLAALLVPAQSRAEDVFEQMDRQIREMEERMRQMRAGFGGLGLFEKEEVEPVRVVASVSASKARPTVGESFEFIVSLDAPATVTLSNVRVSPSEAFGIKVTGKVRTLTDAKSANPSNVVKRLAIPVRYDVPFRGRVSFGVDGMAAGRVTRGGRFSMSFSRSFHADAPAIALEIAPPPSAGRPDGYAGVVSEGLRIHELCDILTVETNDVVCITYRMYPTNGYVPRSYMPPGSAFELSRNENGSTIEYRRFFVADGAPKTPLVKVVYFDPRTQSYKTAAAGGTALKYKPPSP